MSTMVMDQLMSFARSSGPGKTAYPSPRPAEVGDLVLVPHQWVQVHPLFLSDSGPFRRDRQKNLFEFVQADTPPDDLDLSINPAYDRQLNAGQRHLVHVICSSDWTNQYRDAVKVGDLVDDNGISRKNSRVTTGYLRESHRPFLLAVQDLEKRWQKRKVVLSTVKSALERIAKLPG